MAGNKTKLSHVDQTGSASMVDVSNKTVTHRIATAKGILRFSEPETVRLIRDNQMKKGDVLGTARIAGMMAVKRTADLIPLCHPLFLTKTQMDIEVEVDRVVVQCSVHCDGKTGVEMEALTGVMVALGTVYDMCKAADRHMVISDVHVVKKSGGSHDFDLQ
jgi:molybdenum cofactor biosynthesis protein MoaC